MCPLSLIDSKTYPVIPVTARLEQQWPAQVFQVARQFGFAGEETPQVRVERDVAKAS